MDFRHEDPERARYRDERDDRPAPVDRHQGRPPPGKRTLVSRVYRAAAGPAPSGPDAIAALERAAAAAGRSLPPELRAQLEQALGVSLADVRAHDDAASADAARAITARAYTVGQPGDAAEMEADRFADDFASGGLTRPTAARARLGAAAPGVIHRDANTQDKDAEHEAALATVQGKAM